MARLQQALEGLHDIDTALDIRSFMVDEKTRDLLPGANDGLPEQLFVRQAADDEVEISVFISPKVLGHLAEDNPHVRLHDGNLESFTIALEGVSHFVMLAHRGGGGVATRALELELQAEVDKFVQAWLLLGEQGVSLEQAAKGLSRRLFEQYVLRREVPHEEADRYHVATQAASRYCSSLARRFARDGTASRIKRDVRSYFRKGLADKLRG